MSCTYAPSSPADAPFYVHSKSSTFRINNPIHQSQTVSFNSHSTRSRNPSGSSRTRPTTRIQAFYTPAKSTETLYELLGISTESGSSSIISVSDIKKAYKEMAKKYHPDVSAPERVDENTKRFIMVREAYETLSDPQSRESYDRDLGTKGSSFAFSARTRPYHYHQRMEETGEWRMRWHSQLDDLKHMNINSNSRGGRMTWGARMRNQR